MELPLEIHDLGIAPLDALLTPLIETEEDADAVHPEHAPRPMTEEQEDQVHEYAMRILEEIGVDVLHDEGRALLADAGQKVEGDRVRFDRGFVMEQVAKAPHTFTLHARNPANTVEVGGGTPLWMGVGGPPFLSDLDEGRRGGTLEGHDTIIKLTQAAAPLELRADRRVRAREDGRAHTPPRHGVLDDPVVRPAVHDVRHERPEGARRDRDGADRPRRRPRRPHALMGVVNSVSPLIWDFRMVDAMIAWAESNQATVVTPFLLGGATAPVSVAGGLAQQVAEALSGVALAQTVRPGAPCLYGSFFQATDMRTGAPALGTPESIFGVFAGAQLARRYGLPFRGGGGLCSSNAVDAQAAAESAFMLWATVLAGTDVVLHAAGWLEGGLTASLEKFALDVELLEQFQIQQRGIGFSEEEFAFEALAEVGPGRPVARGRHTMQHFKEWQYISPLFMTQDFTTWTAAGGEDGGQPGQPPVEAAARVLRGPRHRRRRRRGAAGVHGSAQGGARARGGALTMQRARERRGSTSSWQDDRNSGPRSTGSGRRSAAAAPDATEGISYSMPAFKHRRQGARLLRRVQGPLQPVPDEQAGPGRDHLDELGERATGKGTIRFAYDERLPVGLVKKIVKTRMAELEARKRR